MALANMDIQILPTVDGGEQERYAVIDAVINHIISTGFKYEVGGLGTTVEGEFNDLIEILKKAQEICFTNGADRVTTIAKFDHKIDGVTIEEKNGKYRQ